MSKNELKMHPKLYKKLTKKAGKDRPFILPVVSSSVCFSFSFHIFFRSFRGGDVKDVTDAHPGALTLTRFPFYIAQVYVGGVFPCFFESFFLGWLSVSI